jgi:O-antigen ligase
MWELSPWLGVGPGNYAAIYPSVALPRWSDPLGHAHNIYLNVLGETGVLGLIAFLLLWASLLGWLLHVMQKTLPSQSWARALATGVLGVLAHLAIHSFFDNLFVQGMYLHIAFWLAAVAATVSVAVPATVFTSGQHPGAKHELTLSTLISESDG